VFERPFVVHRAQQVNSMKEDLLLKAFVGMMVVLTFACAPLRALAQGAGGAVQGAGSAAMGAAKQAGENAAGR
jgi:hypothetical protein